LSLLLLLLLLLLFHAFDAAGGYAGGGEGLARERASVGPRGRSESVMVRVMVLVDASVAHQGAAEVLETMRLMLT